MATHVNRFVVGPDAEGRSTVLQHGLANVQSREGFYWRATLWATQRLRWTTALTATDRRQKVLRRQSRTFPQRNDLPRTGNPAGRPRRGRAPPRPGRPQPRGASEAPAQPN